MSIEALFLFACGVAAAYLAYKFWQVAGQIESLRKELALSRDEKKALREDLQKTRESEASLQRALSECRSEHGAS